MSTANLTAQLQTLCGRIEAFPEKFRSAKARPTKTQHEALRSLLDRLSVGLATLEETIQPRSIDYSLRSAEEGAKLLQHAYNFDPRSDMRLATLKRNLCLVFEGPKQSVIDSSQVKARKKMLAERCFALRELPPSALAKWAAAFAPSSWAPGTMSQETFDFLIGKFQTQLIWEIPPSFCDVLRVLYTEDPLDRHPEYQEFTQAVNKEVTSNVKSTQDIESSRESGVKQAGRQIQYMFSKMTADRLSYLCDPLSKGIQTSNQWTLEKERGEIRTECVNVLIPEGDDEDASVTLWIGQGEVPNIVDLLNLQRTWTASPSNV